MVNPHSVTEPKRPRFGRVIPEGKVHNSTTEERQRDIGKDEEKHRMNLVLGALSSELMADLLLIDEKSGRYYARRAGLILTGTIGILIKAKHHGLIRKLKPLLDKLRASGVWFSDNLMKEALKLGDETDN